MSSFKSLCKNVFFTSIYQSDHSLEAMIAIMVRIVSEQNKHTQIHEENHTQEQHQTKENMESQFRI